MTVLLPRSVDEACAALATAGDITLLGGGTDLMVPVNAGRRPIGTVMALRAIPELRSWRQEGDRLVLGAGTTFTDLLDPELSALVPALAQAARTVGSPQIRNAATLGGNLATASPAGDSLPVLAALDAVVTVRRHDGRRDIPIDAFLVGPKRSALEPGELIVSVTVPAARGPQEFMKVGTRNAMVIAVANAAVVADLVGHQITAAVGSVGPTVLRAPRAERWVVGHIDWDTATVPDPRTYETFGEMVADAALPIDDHRSTAAYRRHCVSVLARRALLRMFPG